MSKQTTRDIDMQFRDLHTLRVPKGTPVKWIEGGTGGYAVEPGGIELKSKTESLFKHDSTYYYIWIDAKDVGEG